MILKGAALIGNPTFAPKIEIKKNPSGSVSPNILLHSMSHCHAIQDLKLNGQLCYLVL